jgi:hypothetical protein
MVAVVFHGLGLKTSRWRLELVPDDDVLVMMSW